MFDILLLSGGMMFLKFAHVVACIINSFLFIAKQFSIVQIYHFLFIPSPLDDTKLFPLWGYYEQCFCEHSLNMFCADIPFQFLRSFQRNFQTILQGYCTILLSYHNVSFNFCTSSPILAIVFLVIATQSLLRGISPWF